MRDEEYLKWVANHLVMYRPAFGGSYMEWIDDSGFEHSKFIKVDGAYHEDILLLKACIDKVKNELM